MKYCIKCLQPDTRPGIQFDHFGLCPACNYHDSLAKVDWGHRMDELQEIVAFGRKYNQTGYDCIIGVSGGKDSTRQAIFVKTVLGMKPLLVNLAYPPEQITQRGVDNVSNMLQHGFDCISINPAPQTWRALMRKGFFEYTNWARSTELALFSSVPRLAIAYQIPLIWWGENPALTLGDKGGLSDKGFDGNKARYNNTLGGGDITWLLDSEIRKSDIIQYCYPSQEDMERAHLRIIYLGYFWEKWSLIENGNFSALRGLEIRNEKPWEIGDPLGITSLDENWVTLNQMIKYLKYGFGRITDYVNEDIRNGRMTRDVGISLCERFDGTCSSQYIESFSAYIGITVQQFWDQVDKSVNKKLFSKEAIGVYKPRFKVGIGI